MFFFFLSGGGQGKGFPASQVALVVKNLLASAGDIRDMGLVPGSGRSPGGAHGNPLQCSCRENPMDRGAWWAAVHGAAQSQTRLKLHSTHANFGGFDCPVQYAELPWPGIKPSPMRWKLQDLTTGPPGKSESASLIIAWRMLRELGQGSHGAGCGGGRVWSILADAFSPA